MARIFISYRSGDDGGYVEALLRDIRATVHSLERPGVPTETFLSSDDAVHDGDWTPEATRALATCTVFLAVCSDRYLLTERCGREWQSFQERLERHEALTGRRKRALLPIAWGAPLPGTELPGAELPGAAHTDTVALQEDARALIRVRAHRSRYRSLVQRLAERIVAVSREDAVLPAVGPLSYASTRNAFRAAAVTAPGVRFLIAAGERAEMAEVRHDVDYYGEHRADWQPYRSGDRKSLAAVAQAIATEQLYRSEVVAEPEQILELLAAGRPPTDEVVVMLLDAWAVRLAAYREVLTSADRAGAGSPAVVIPLSADDDETATARSSLGAALAEALARRSAHRDPTLRIGPESAERFSDEIGDILETARNVSFRSAAVRRTAPGRPAASRPILDAP